MIGGYERYVSCDKWIGVVQIPCICLKCDKRELE